MSDMERGDAAVCREAKELLGDALPTVAFVQPNLLVKHIERIAGSVFAF